MGSGVIKASDPRVIGKGLIKGKTKAIYVTAIPPDQLQISGDRGKMGLTGKKVPIIQLLNQMKIK